MHLKRQEMPKTFAIRKKGAKYIVRASHNFKTSIPLLVALRDILKIAKNRKEAKKLISQGKIKVNCKIVKEEKYPLTLFDNLTLNEKNFKLVLENKKFKFLEAKGNEKIAKVIGKKILKKGMQINLSDGRNFLAKEKIKIGDSVVINEGNKISEILPFKEGSKIIFTSGKHLGEEGKIELIDEKKKIVAAKIKEGKINTKLGSLMVIK